MWRTSRRGLAVRQLNLRRDDGVAMTEFALILPIFMVIVAGLLGFGRVFFYWIEANHTASETARWAIVDQNPFNPQTLQEHAAQSSTGEFESDVRVCISMPEGPVLGERLVVKVQKPFSFLPILNVGTITIRGSSTMRIENFNGPNGSGPTAYATGNYKGRACT
jgi:hypothetical protein